MPFIPLPDHVPARRIGADTLPASWFFIADSARNLPIEGQAVGVGAKGENGDRVVMDVKAGDRILFGKRTSAERPLDGEDSLILKESEIFGPVA